MRFAGCFAVWHRRRWIVSTHCSSSLRLIAKLAGDSFFAFTASQGKCLPISPNDPWGTPAARPFGFAALLGPTGSRRTRGCAPQTCCDSFSRQPCATRPRKRGPGVRADSSVCALIEIQLAVCSSFAKVGSASRNFATARRRHKNQGGWQFEAERIRVTMLCAAAHGV